MDCATLHRIFAGERGEDLGEPESAAFDAHLEACASCRDALAGAEDELAPLVDRFEPPPVPDAGWARVTAAVQAELRAAPVTSLEAARRRRPTFPLWLAAAAAVLLLAGVGFVLSQGWGGLGAPADDKTATMGGTGGGAGADEDAATDPGREPRPAESTAPTAATELVRLEAGPGYEAGSSLEGELLCLWVRER